MCVAASKRDGLVITTQDLVDGMGLLAATEDGMPRVFAGVGKNVLALDIEMIYANILANPDGISFGSLLDMFKHSIRKEELEEVLETLRMIGKVQALQDDKRGIIYLPLRKSK
jgi:hypothetical protein